VNNKIDKKTIKKGLLPYLFIFVMMLCVYYVFMVVNKDVNDLSYDEFIEKLDKGKVTELQLVASGSGYVYEVTGKLSDYKENETFEATLPLSDEVMKKIVEASDNQAFKLVVKPDPESSTVLVFIVNFLPILLLVVLAFWFFNKQMAGNKNSLDF
jgi:cell division protease FtsH